MMAKTDLSRPELWPGGQCHLHLRDDTEIWLATDTAAHDPAIDLSDHETSRINRLKAPQAAARFERSRRFIRAWLAHALNCPAHEVRIELSDLGAPLPFAGTDKPNPSWSRSEGWTGLGLSRHPAFGLDIERPRPLDHRAMLETICGEGELAALSTLPETEIADLFWRIWTAKEAILKALGTGFQTPADQLELPIGQLTKADQPLHFDTLFGATELHLKRFGPLYLAGAWINR